MYNSGYQVGLGDVMIFGQNGFDLSGDTILFQGKPAGIISGLDKDDLELEVRSLSSDERGTYYSTREFTR